jgi:hypothetical protein
LLVILLVFLLRVKRPIVKMPRLARVKITSSIFKPPYLSVYYT